MQEVEEFLKETHIHVIDGLNYIFILIDIMKT